MPFHAAMKVFHNFSVSALFLRLSCVLVSVYSKKLQHVTMKKNNHILDVNPCHCLDP
jgi:hypothetical protein